MVHAFASDVERGVIADECLLLELDPASEVPDGPRVDAAGDLWIALCGGGRIQHHAPDGALLEAVFAVPAARTTSCAFAGPALDEVFVTTATEAWTTEQRRADPASGVVYRLAVGVVRRPTASFRPEPTGWQTFTGRGPASIYQQGSA